MGLEVDHSIVLQVFPDVISDIVDVREIGLTKRVVGSGLRSVAI